MIAAKRNNFYFCQLKSKDKAMCTITVNVDEAMLKEMDPNLSDKTAIRKWVQQLIDLRIQQMELEDNETMDLEEARAMLHETIRKVYTEG